jgi:hypothetical protein
MYGEDLIPTLHKDFAKYVNFANTFSNRITVITTNQIMHILKYQW